VAVTVTVTVTVTVQPRHMRGDLHVLTCMAICMSSPVYAPGELASRMTVFSMLYTMPYGPWSFSHQLMARL
jgi:hypothetical protein